MRGRGSRPLQATITRAVRPRRGGRGVAHHRPGLGEPLDGLLRQLGGRARPGHPDEPVQPALHGEDRTRRDDHPAPLGLRGQGRRGVHGSSHQGRARRWGGGTASRAADGRTAAASRSRCSRSRSRWWAETCAPSVSRRARTSCSSTGAPRSRETRAWVSRSMLPRGARIQPSRRPPQKLLLALPRVRVSGANEANGRGIDRSSRASAWCASSTTAIVRDRRRTPG